MLYGFRLTRNAILMNCLRILYSTSRRIEYVPVRRGGDGANLQAVRLNAAQEYAVSDYSRASGWCAVTSERPA